MTENGPIFLTLGLLFLLGLATDYLGRITSLPRVTLLILFGILLGYNGLDVLDRQHISDWFPLITDAALLLVGFLLGGKLKLSDIRENGAAVFWISGAIVVISVVLVTSSLWLIGTSITLAVFLGAVSTATDPAATLDVVAESGARGQFTSTLQGIVAVDDIWGLVVFSIILALAELTVGSGVVVEVLLHGARELLGSIALGIALGLPMAFLTGRIKPGEPTLVEALGLVFLCGGLAQWFGVSHLLTAMVLGATVTNFARHHEQAFHEIENIEWPFMILFFVLIGASLEHVEWHAVWWVTVVFMLTRTASRVVGAWLGARRSQSSTPIRHWVGLALLPQAGLANGMALMASTRFPEIRDVILPVTVISTIAFEVGGPVITRMVLKRVGEARPLP